MNDQLFDVFVRMPARKALADANAEVELLLPHIEDRCKLSQNDNGIYQVQILDERGTPRIKNANCDPVTIEDLIREMRDHPTFACCFHEKKTESTAPQPPGRRNPFRKEEFNLTEQARLLKTDPALAETLKREAQAETETGKPKPPENPFMRDQLNLTKAAEIYRRDPELARTLMARAGYPA